MSKFAVISALGLFALSGCAAPTPAPAPEPIPNCAVPSEDRTTDGGYGGTGNLPEDCPPDLRA